MDMPVCSEELTTTDMKFSISQRIPAGTVGPKLKVGALIFTGATIPKGTDTVVIQEACEESTGKNTVKISTLVPTTYRGEYTRNR